MRDILSNIPKRTVQTAILSDPLSPIRLLWGNQWRAILSLAALVAVSIWVLALTQPHKLTDGVWTLNLVGDCYLDYHTPIQVVALACPGGLYPAVAVAGQAAMAGPNGLAGVGARVAWREALHASASRLFASVGTVKLTLEVGLNTRGKRGIVK
jgi:hypothetical protein